MDGNADASFNTAVGAEALSAAHTGAENTAIGYQALERNIGTGNIALGFGAGSLASTGSYNIYIGRHVFGFPGETNAIHIGLQGIQARAFIGGIRGAVTGQANAVPVMIDSSGQLGTVSSSRRFKEDIKDMANASHRLFSLRPVTFRYTAMYDDGSKPIQYGLIAEEVAQAFPELAVRDDHGNIETVHYETLNVLLLNEMQKQQRRIDALERRLNELLNDHKRGHAALP
jgi:hypothetical protein